MGRPQVQKLHRYNIIILDRTAALYIIDFSIFDGKYHKESLRAVVINILDCDIVVNNLILHV